MTVCKREGASVGWGDSRVGTADVDTDPQSLVSDGHVDGVGIGNNAGEKEDADEDEKVEKTR